MRQTQEIEYDPRLGGHEGSIHPPDNSPLELERKKKAVQITIHRRENLAKKQVLGS